MWKGSKVAEQPLSEENGEVWFVQKKITHWK